VPDTRRAKPRGLFYCLGRTDRVKRDGAANLPQVSHKQASKGDERMGHDTVGLEDECGRESERLRS
jgi:hypothetical protein